MDTYEVEFEPVAPDRFGAVVPALPGLLVLGGSVEEVLERAQEAIEYRMRQADGTRARQIRTVLRAASFDFRA